MKKLSILLTCVLVTTFFASQAQVKPAVLNENLSSTDENLAKNAINLLIISKFHESFPVSSDEVWTKTNNSYMVTFTADKVLNRVFLDKKGKTTGQIRYYQENGLPATVRDMVKTFGGCFTIGGVTEVSTEAGTVYLVNINEETSWKILRVAGDKMDVYEEHRKG
jgi:hypothetical protein